MGVEIIWVVLVLVIITLGIIAGYGAFSDLNDDIQGDLDISSEAKTAAETTVGNYPTQMDNVIVFLFFLLWGFLVIGAFFANSHPVWLFVTLILMIFGLVIIMILANAYEEMINEDGISSFANEFPRTNWLMEHILLVMVFVGFSTLLILYGRSGS